MRALRLEMLRDEPIAYAETLEHALDVDESGWRLRARRGETAGQTALVAIEGPRWIGTMGGYVPDAATGPMLVGVFVAPDRRGDGRCGCALPRLSLAPTGPPREVPPG